jgi:hypothetical protein
MADREHVAIVQRQIEALGVDVYLAEHDPHPGQSIAERVERELLRCDAVVVLITTNSVDAAYVHQEIGLGRAHRKPIFPIVDKRVDKTRLGMLTEVEWLEIDLDEPAEALARITQSLQPLMRAQVSSQTQPDLVAAGAGNDIGSSFVLIGIGLLLGLLIASIAFSGEAGGTEGA